MPILAAMRSAILVLLLGPLAGCGPPRPDKFATFRPQTVSPAAAGVRAFAHICGRLEEGEVLTRAAGYGFAPLPADRAAAILPPTLRDSGLRLLVRPVAGAPSLLVWTAGRPACELALGGVEPAAVTAEFNSLVAGLTARPELSVAELSPDLDRSTSMRLRRIVIVTPKALTPTPPRAISLRVNEDSTQALQVSLSTSAQVPQATPTPPPGPWLPKQ